jgi:hypothetical protein
MLDHCNDIQKSMFFEVYRLTSQLISQDAGWQTVKLDAYEAIGNGDKNRSTMSSNDLAAKKPVLAQAG